jgi:hypothetical protein
MLLIGGAILGLFMRALARAMAAVLRGYMSPEQPTATPTPAGDLPVALLVVRVGRDLRADLTPALARDRARWSN